MKKKIEILGIDLDLDIKLHKIEERYRKYAVIITYENNELVLVRHRERETWEIPGGHHEIGETILETAKRELFEETGAIDFETKHIADYSVKKGNEINYGGLFEAHIINREKKLGYEISEVKKFTKLPPVKKVTHGMIQIELVNFLSKKLSK
ncbi:NUDIX domain-containing protein [Psychrilyobacter sp.]|uniref:NUDIX domain-containing protein n=1 Tax=Psychrilyobacter sp. TaxID=2586924 RepID=UPI0030166BAE